jgi:IclR family transcriptional regulator, acetate operon repressor
MRRSDAVQETPPIQSLDRGLMILEAVANSTSPVSLAELTNLIGIDRSSVFRLASTLKRRGFLAYPAGRKDYILGPTMWRLAHRYDWGTMLARVAQEHLRNLARLTNETAHLAVREGKQALFIDHATANHVLSVSGQTGEMVPLYCTAHGKALLADCGIDELTRIFGIAHFPPHTEKTMRTVSELAKACSEIRTKGFAADNGEFQEGVRCAAAPIRAENGTIVGSIGISAPIQRLTHDRFQQCVKFVLEAANEISASLANELTAGGKSEAPKRARAR